MQPTMADQLPELGQGHIDGNVTTRDIRNFRHLREDLWLLLTGKIDLPSLIQGFKATRNPVTMKVRDGQLLIKHGYFKALERAGFQEGVDNVNVEPFRSIINDPYWDKVALRQVTRSKNLRVTMGRDDIQRIAMWGDIAASNNYTGVSGTATSAPTATGFTNTAAAFPTSGGLGAGGIQGHVVYFPVAGVFGVITATTATTVTVDQWTNANSATGAAGTTPANGAAYIISAGCGTSPWVGISTNSAAAAAGDVLRTADGLFGDGTTSGAATEQSTNGLARAFQQATAISAGIQYQYTWTYSGSSLVTIYKGVMCNSLAAAGSLLMLETLMNNPASLNASPDTLQLTWQATL